MYELYHRLMYGELLAGEIASSNCDPSGIYSKLDTTFC